VSGPTAKPLRRPTGVFLRVTMPDGGRPLVKLGPVSMSDGEVNARAQRWHDRRDEMIALYLAGRAKRAPRKAESTCPTFKEFAEKWTSGELAKLYPDHVKKKATSHDDVYRLAKHVYPALGATRLDAITIDDTDAVMTKLSATLEPGSRRQVAQLMSRVLAMAAYPAKLIKSSPIPRGYLPKKGARKALSALYPDEDRRLIGCANVKLCYRVLYGFLDREGMRAGEAAALDWGSLDLGRGAVKLDENKTDDPRAWALCADTRRALQAWRKMREAIAPELVADDAPVFVQENGARVNVDRGAERFRSHLKAAKVDRPELFERTATRRPIRIHDTRATFITVSLATDRSDTWVKDRTGHRSSQMVENYRRQARALSELNLGTLAPMDEAIPELSAAAATGDLTGVSVVVGAPSGVLAEDDSATITAQYTRRDLNPHALRRRNLNPLRLPIPPLVRTRGI